MQTRTIAILAVAALLGLGTMTDMGRAAEPAAGTQPLSTPRICVDAGRIAIGEDCNVALMKVADACPVGYKLCTTYLGRTCCAPAEQRGCYCP